MFFRKKINSDNILNKIENKNLLKRYLLLILGLLLYSITYNAFFVKNNLIFGGSSSVATIFKDFVSPPITILFISVIALLLSFIFLGKKEAANTVVGSFLFPLFVTFTSGVSLPIPKDDMMLVAICGAVLIGLANGIMGRSGLGSGGIDSIVHILEKKLKISSGKAFMFFNGLVVMAGGFRFGWRVLLYALIILYIISIVQDRVVMSISMNKTFFIVTSKVDEVKDYILTNLSRGVTTLTAHGGFSEHKQEVIMAVIPTVEYFKAKEGILEIDPNAFFTITDSYQVYGQDSHRKKREEIED
ncbi:MAG: YitT family protein [Bacilli bacterium]|nr:YitT family protein [Bacilli bacterium]